MKIYRIRNRIPFNTLQFQIDRREYREVWQVRALLVGIVIEKG